MQVTRVAPGRPVPSLMHRRRVMADRITYVGLDVHKESIVVAVAEGGLARRGAGVRPDRQHGGGAGPFAAQAWRRRHDAAVLLRGWGHSGAPVPVRLNSTDPAARRCTVASFPSRHGCL